MTRRSVSKPMVCENELAHQSASGSVAYENELVSSPRSVPELMICNDELVPSPRPPPSLAPATPTLSSPASEELDSVPRGDEFTTTTNLAQILNDLQSPQPETWEDQSVPPKPESSLGGAPPQPDRKQPRASFLSSVSGNTLEQETATSSKKHDLINYWRRVGDWPEEYFKQDDQTREDAKEDFEEDNWTEEIRLLKKNYLLAHREYPPTIRGRIFAMQDSMRGHILAMHKSLRESETGSTTMDSQNSKFFKDPTYNSAAYEVLLASKDSYMDNSELGATATSKSLSRTLLEAEQIFPGDSLFRDDLFEATCRMVRNRNEAKIIDIILPLIVPFAEVLAIRGAKHLKILIEGRNDGWTNSIPITKTRPQPNYSVAFKREAFTKDQHKRLEPLVGELGEPSFYMGTFYMYFPFLTCEVKCDATALDVADRQNAHSMTMAVRGVVELFRVAKRQDELHREILAFSISHNHESVRIYGHYPEIDGEKTSYYRYLIHKFDITVQEGKDRWTAYRFTKNVYDLWMPTHFKRICSVIDELPLNGDLELGSGLPQGCQSYPLSDQSGHDAASPEQVGGQPSGVNLSDVTLDTSPAQRIEEGAFEKPRKRIRLIYEAEE